MPYGDMMTGAIRRTATRKPVAATPAVDFGNSGSMQTAAQNAYGTEAGYGSDATSSYLARAKAFDPQAAVSTYAQGAWGSISDALKKTLSDTRGGAVGAGRYDSGYLDEDQGTVINQATKQLSDSIAQQSVAASGQALSNNSAMGQFAESTTQDANELLASERERQANADEQKKKARAAKGSAIGTGIGAIGGAFFGGPVGAGIGGTIGGALGGLF
jgi:hypothetical protein